MMIPLPNNKWLRSPRMPEYALCFDRNDPFFLWKMVENVGYVCWTSVSRLTPEELVKLVRMDDPLVEPFKPVIQAEIDRLNKLTGEVNHG